MQAYLVEYHTQNQFDSPVEEGHFELTVLPCKSDSQDLQTLEFSHSLEGPSFLSNNKYNFETLHVRTQRSFKKFQIQLKAWVLKSPPELNVRSDRSIKEENKHLEDYNFYIQHHLFLQTTPLTKLHKDELNPVWLRNESEESVGTYVSRLNQLLAEHIQYDLSLETASQALSAHEVLSHQTGLCQDFSHLMIAILRLQNIPARYVSGYLHAEKITEGAQLHAWVEAFIPFLGWRGFDPVNQLREDTNYIKIAHGRDYLDCRPFKGALQKTSKTSPNYWISIQKKKTNFHSKMTPQ